MLRTLIKNNFDDDFFKDHLVPVLKSSNLVKELVKPLEKFIPKDTISISYHEYEKSALISGNEFNIQSQQLENVFSSEEKLITIEGSGSAIACRGASGQSFILLMFAGHSGNQFNDEQISTIQLCARQVSIYLFELRELAIEKFNIRKKLVKSNRGLKDFAYIVSHDLKAPLRAIGSLAQWLEEDHEKELTSEIIKQLHMIRAKVKKSNDMLAGLARYAKIDWQNIENEPVDLAALFNVLQNQYASNDDRVVIRIGARMPTVQGDRDKLDILFQNLVENAIQHNDKDLIEIDITSEYNDEEKCYQVTIADNGPGIKEEYHARIFELFQTLQPKDQSKTAGMGLAIVQKLVDELGASIAIDSSPGNGSRFILTMPPAREVSNNGG